MHNRTALFLFVIVLLCCSLTWAQAQAPVVLPAGTVNAADYSRALVPGGLISVFGVNFAAGQTSASTVPLPITLGGASVEITDASRTQNAPIWWVSPGQINAQLPTGLTGPIQVVVRTAAGASNADQVAVVPSAPRFFTFAENGVGRPVMTHGNNQVVTRAAPAIPGETMVLYMNSLGPVQPSIQAGNAPGNGSGAAPYNLLTDPISLAVNKNAARVVYAGLAPGMPGVFQVNFVMPYDNVAGDVDITVKVGSDQTQAAVTIPVEPNGFYWALTGSKFANGQTMNGVGGANSALVFRQNDVGTWGQRGFKAWDKNTGLDVPFTATSGVAMTLKSGGSVVFDNNGIENGSQGSYYDNRDGVPEASKPGLYVMYCMSNNLPGVWAGYFRLTQRTTVDQLIGYFDGLGQQVLPFDPANIYNQYRMNIWSNGSGGAPKDTGDYVGDVFTSDKTPGKFSYSDTGVARVFSDGTKKPIYRLVYTLNSPLTLEAGEYWFSHDVAVPATATAAATNATGEKAAGVEEQHLNTSFQRMRPKAPITNER